jgi:hypothetical protein
MLSACSATYSNADLIHLTSIAEMAATQGYDLYTMSVNGKSLETAIEFLLNAYQNPALLAQYSKAGGGSCFDGNPCATELRARFANLPHNRLAGIVSAGLSSDPPTRVLTSQMTCEVVELRR